MRAFAAFSLLVVLPGLARAAVSDDSWASSTLDAARAAFSAKPLPAVPSTPVDEGERIRAAVLAQFERNPVAARFAAPVIKIPGAVTFLVRGESEDKSLKGAWATFKRDSRSMVLNRDAINEDLASLGRARPCDDVVPGRPLSPQQLSAIAKRYLPVFAHELGGHARHYAELAVILGAPAPNARETEIDALRLEAMTTAAERKTDSNYLRDDAAYARGESALVDKYWESKEKNDPALFRDYVSAVPGYAKIPMAPAGPIADYYRDDERRLLMADQALIGNDPPSDEIGIGRRTPFDDGPGRGRR